MKFQGSDLIDLTDAELDAAEVYMINAVEKTRDHYQLMVDGYRAVSDASPKRNALEMIAAAIANVTALQATLAMFTPYLMRGG